VRIGNLLFLYRQRVRTHPLQELVALLGIAVGVALVFAVQVANTSVTGSVEQLMRGITGSAELQVTARDPHGFDTALVNRIAAVPGVTHAAPLLEIRVNLRGGGELQTVSLIGGDERLSTFGGTLMRELVSPHLRLVGAIALPAPLADRLDARRRVRLELGTASRVVPVATQLDRDQVGALVDSPIALAPLPYAQRITGMQDRVTRVLVQAAPGQAAAVRARLQRLVGDGVSVVAGDREARLLRQATAPNDQSTALFAAISALVGLLFAFNAMLLTVPERRRFLADLRLEGLGDATVVRLVLFDALVLGVIASALGLLLGDVLSRHVFHAVPGYLSYAFTVGDQRIVELRSILLAVAGGIGVTLLAALRPLSDLFSRRPLDEVYRADDERNEDARVRRRWLVTGGTGFVAAATAVLLFVPSATIVGVMLLVTGMLFLIPGALGGVLRLLDTLSHHVRSRVLVVSVGELRATTTRSIALAATGALAVFGSVAMQGAQLDLQRGLDRDAHELNASADLWVTQRGAENALATTPFRPPPPRLLTGVPGVRVVRPYRGSFLDIGDRRLWVLAPPAATAAPIPPSQVVEGDMTVATDRLRRGGWGTLSTAVAHERGLEIGDTFVLPTPRPQPLRLAAVTTNLGWAPGAVIVSSEDYARAWDTRDVSALQILLEPGADPQAVSRATMAALGAGRGLEVETAERREERFRESSRQGLDRLTQIATLVLVAAAVAMAAAMAGVVWLRRPRLAALKLTGFDDGPVWRMLLLESVVVLGVGCSIGALFGLYGQLMLTRWLRDVTGFPTSYAVAGTLALEIFIAVTLVAVLFAALPGYLAARTSPIASLRSD
jgi:putative ABC transport system permease protein